MTIILISIIIFLFLICLGLILLVNEYHHTNKKRLQENQDLHLEIIDLNRRFKEKIRQVQGMLPQ